MELTFAHVYSSNPKRARSGELALPASLGLMLRRTVAIAK
jgi:hypothetical protein